MLVRCVHSERGLDSLLQVMVSAIMELLGCWDILYTPAIYLEEEAATRQQKGATSLRLV